MSEKNVVSGSGFDAAVGQELVACGPFPGVSALVALAEAQSDVGRPRRLLDLCCGTGQILKEFAEIGWQTFGIEESVELVAVALFAMESHANSGVTRLPGSDFVELPGGLFDMILAFDSVADSFSSDAALSSVALLALDRLADDGLFVLQCPQVAGRRASAVIERLERLGFLSVRRVSPVDLCRAIGTDAPHGGAYDVFLCRR